MFDKRIKANSASTGICQHDAYIGWAIVSRTEHNVQFAQGRQSPIFSGSGSSTTSRIRASASLGTCTKLAWLRAGVGMITMSSASIFTILQFNTVPLVAWQVMQRRVTGYIAFGATFRVPPILQLSAPGSKNHRRCTSIAGRRPHSAPRDSE
jgi:hypothetical protein